MLYIHIGKVFLVHIVVLHHDSAPILGYAVKFGKEHCCTNSKLDRLKIVFDVKLVLRRITSRRIYTQ